MIRNKPTYKTSKQANYRSRMVITQTFEPNNNLSKQNPYNNTQQDTSWQNRYVISNLASRIITDTTDTTL